jgi:hypothetical protein
MKGKKSVLVYCDVIHTVEKLDDENAGLLFKHFLRYVNDQEPEAPNLLVEIAFEGIKQTLKRDLKTWENKSEARSKSGRIGNLKRYNPDIYEEYNKGIYTLDEAEELAKDCKGSQNIATVAVNDSDKVKVIVNDKDIVINNIDEREAEFKNSLRPYIETYGEPMIKKFFLYWTEKKPKGKKMRFEMEKVFDIQRRLITWNDRNFNNANKNENGKPITKSRLDKFIRK